MEIISVAYKTKAESDFNLSTVYAFIEPSFAGNHVVEAELIISANDLSEYDSVICDSYSEAHRKAFLSQMSEKDYDFLYESMFAVDFPHE
ncbi:MAG TPA: hypothetical protein GX708_21145 [Gallicola sp.]|nr:hypothetical protein [Gallicola sp.]